MKVDLHGKTFVFPQRCVCCGRTPSGAIPAPDNRPGRWRGRADWTFPACADCLRHVATWRSAEVFARRVTYAGVGLAILATAVGGWWGLLVGCIAALGARIWARKWRQSGARGECHSDCACPWQPVWTLGGGAGIDSFLFAQNAYALDFMRANLTKLVNLSAEAMRLLQPDFERMALEEAGHRRDLELRREAERERARLKAEIEHDNEAFSKWLGKVAAARGPTGRRSAVESAMRVIRQAHVREQFLVKASQIEVSAALSKAEGLKSTAAKLRALREALEAVRSDAVPDELQRDQIRELEEAIAVLEDEKNTIEIT
jgi:hypothetical protein